MFCPQCRSEYREGFTECNDCQVALVANAPAEEEPKPEYQDFVEIMTVFSEVHMALIKAAFDEADVDYYLHREFAHHLIPLQFSVRLMVKADQEARGREILKELDLK